jgi:CheY-like chemotaxis protein/GGDEF domain-containing protein
MLLIELDHFDVYNEIYGYLAGNQVLRAFGAMVSNLVVAPDMIGHSSETDTFIVITSSDRAEKMANLLCRQFQDVAPNFYTEVDRKRGYIVAVDEHKVSRRVPLLTLSIGIVNSQTQPYETYKAAFTAGMDMKSLAKQSAGDAWVSDKLKLTGAKAVSENQVQSILVVESDAALAFLLKTTLEMQSYVVDTVSSVEEAKTAMADKAADLVLMDSLLNEEEVGWELCRQLVDDYTDTTVIFISTLHDRDKALSSLSQLYLPKAIELMALFNAIDRILKND